MPLGENAKFNPKSAPKHAKRNRPDETRSSGERRSSERPSQQSATSRSNWEEERQDVRLGSFHDAVSRAIGRSRSAVAGDRGGTEALLRDVGRQRRAAELRGTALGPRGGGAPSGGALTHEQQVRRYQNLFWNLGKLVKPFYRNKKKAQEDWKYKHSEDHTTTTSSGSDTFYTARESMHSSPELGKKKGSSKKVEFAPGEKLQVDEDALEDPVLRTPFMMLLLFADEVLIFCSIIFLARWLINYRGGVPLQKAFWPGDTLEPKHAVNLHAIAMSFCFAFCLPQVTVSRIFFERFSEKTRLNIELTIRCAGFVAFLIGMLQIYSVEGLPSAFDGPDKGIHLILSVAAVTVYLISTLNFVLNTVIFYYGGVQDTIVLGYVISLFLNSHVVETLGHLLDLIAFLSLLTGYLAYIILLFTASHYDIAHIFNDPISSEPDDTVQEDEAYLTVLIVLTFMYLTTVCIVFYQHNILYHNGIITYQMYRNNFKEIADALARAKNQKEAIQEMTDIEALCQYENPRASQRLSQGMTPKDGAMLTRRSVPAAAASAKIEPAKMPQNAATANK